MDSQACPRKALILVLADPSGSPRPKRAFHLLEDMGFDVEIVSYRIHGELSPKRHYEIPEPIVTMWLRLFRKAVFGIGLVLCRLPLPAIFYEKFIATWFRLEHLDSIFRDAEYDLLIVEDIILLPFALKNKKKGKVLFDAREYYSRQKEDSLVFRVVEQPLRMRLCNHYLRQCDQMVTVSEGLADEYCKEFQVNAQVVRSTPGFSHCLVRPVSDGKLRMVHHGVANKNRKLENMLQMMELLDDRFSLDLFLTGKQNYIAELKNFARKSLRIVIHDPVPFESIIPTLKAYDIGIFFVEPTTFNLFHCLPNKFFEFIQARLMVAIGPSPDMASLVREYDCGIVAESFDLHDMAKALNQLNTEQIIQYKQNSDIAARELCWEQEGIKLRQIIEKLLKSNVGDQDHWLCR